VDRVFVVVQPHEETSAASPMAQGFRISCILITQWLFSRFFFCREFSVACVQLALANSDRDTGNRVALYAEICEHNIDDISFISGSDSRLIQITESMLH